MTTEYSPAESASLLTAVAQSFCRALAPRVANDPDLLTDFLAGRARFAVAVDHVLVLRTDGDVSDPHESLDLPPS